MKKKTKKEEDNSAEEKKFPLPTYKKEDDIYIREKEESLEHIDNSVTKEFGYKRNDPDEVLDVPGEELDDADEGIGEEDEENNYYSLGGDAHNDLEEERE